ncbi:hypothetical protein [Azospirillum sp. B4]|uniref:hypothetical protein n=1 Tax=Azospirillum sp. B4 TaxID=95605 RepID=UPI0003460101|nr:hypothetical protein [Azospirillum sp. B4]
MDPNSNPTGAGNDRIEATLAAMGISETDIGFAMTRLALLASLLDKAADAEVAGSATIIAGKI